MLPCAHGLSPPLSSSVWVYCVGSALCPFQDGEGRGLTQPPGDCFCVYLPLLWPLSADPQFLFIAGPPGLPHSVPPLFHLRTQTCRPAAFHFSHCLSCFFFSLAFKVFLLCSPLASSHIFWVLLTLLYPNSFPLSVSRAFPADTGTPLSAFFNSTLTDTCDM